MEPSPDDMAVLQKLSNEYEPELKGPLVGPKLSTEVISQEYAQADPVYVAKTAALAESNSHYRVMKGDGNCGWRAVAFAYFENLFRTGDISKVAHELSRIKGFNQQLFAVGHEEHLFEIFVEATEEVFARIANAIEEESQDESFLVDAFNNEYNSSAIITHFRLMTSAWMRLNPERYAPFLQIPLEQYCASTIDTVKTEIDELGLQGLADGVIAASGFSLEVMYLDRSEGNEVTVHSLTPGNLPRPDFETITLLYRPGHYDILYGGSKGESSGTPAVNQCSTTFRYVPAHTSILPFQFSPALMTIPKLALVTPMGSYPPSPSEGYRSLELHVREGSCEPEPQTPRSFGKLPTPAPTSTTDLPIRMNPLMNAPMNHLPLTSLPFKK
ncbi:hypothetical protein FQN57_005641 [Myotisia sp. PD_48]|nr:hypothetical protein FQN57_005641 [Myotisia sp. PD_48]